MNLNQLLRISPAIAALYVGGLLLWEHFHGGIQSHHFLAREDMPAVSNAWGMVVLPLLTWLGVKSLRWRMAKRYPEGNVPPDFLRNIGWAFLGAAIYAAAIAIAFVSGRSDISGTLFPALFILGLFLPLYRAEYYLGFVAALSAAFGTVLPAVIGGVVVAVSFVLNGYLWPLLKRLRPSNRR
jgi:uncharacterized membrane protein YjgN (DUF898 family)